MRSDGYQTSDLAFACALLYVFGEDSLLRIERDQVRGQTFFIDAPSFDCQSYFDEWTSSEGLAISNLKAYFRIYDFIVRRLKDLQRRGETGWCSESWVSGRGR